MISLEDTKVNTIVYSYQNDFESLLSLYNLTPKIHKKIEYESSEKLFLFSCLILKKQFDEFFSFLKELITINSIGENEIIVMKDFHEFNSSQQNSLKSFFTKRVFVLLTTKYSLLNRSLLSYFVLKKIPVSEKKSFLKELLKKKIIALLKNTDIDQCKEFAYILLQSGVDVPEFFGEICSELVGNPVITISVKCEIIKTFEKYERYYQKSYKDLVVLEGFIIKLYHELKYFTHCL
tara:strand:+ start:983 stop:1687 length:705 start_codon:yes stop_codon:yes gene_type:complete